jgi:hypothetical protein
VKVLSLVAGGVVVHNAGDMETNIETSNGSQRIKSTFQVDYSFGLGLKGYSFSSSVKSPTDAELATGSHWTKTATSIKHTAGVVTLGETK